MFFTNCTNQVVINRRCKSQTYKWNGETTSTFSPPEADTNINCCRITNCWMLHQDNFFHHTEGKYKSEIGSTKVSIFYSLSSNSLSAVYNEIPLENLDASAAGNSILSNNDIVSNNHKFLLLHQQH